MQEAAQHQELPLPAERQAAIINQYPHDFCLSLSSCLDQINQTSSDVRNKDLEPGRCKRTDGKKWRCSKPAVAPNHKYCDRHLNRGRTRRRSRKLVETQPSDDRHLHLHYNHNNNHFSPLVSTSTADYPLFLLPPPPPDHHSSDDAYFPSFSSQEPHSGNNEVAFEDEWNQLLLKDMGFMTAGGLTYDGSVFRRDLSAVGSSLLPDIIETPTTGFNETNYQSSSLTLSMAMAAVDPIKSQRDLILTNTDDGEISRQGFSGFLPNKRRRMVSSDRDQLLPHESMGGYILDINGEEEEEDDDHKPLKSNWSSVVTDGGPLAEALRPCLPFWGSE